MADQGISELFYQCLMWASENGAPVPLTVFWEGELGPFKIAVNGSRKEATTSEGVSVPPLHVCINAPKYAFAVMLVSADGGFGPVGMEDDALAAILAARKEPA